MNDTVSTPRTKTGAGRSPLRDNLRILWAIAAKDIMAAIRNKQALSALISGLFVIVMYRYLPQITGDIREYRLYLHDAGDATAVAVLENSPDLRTRTYPSEARVVDLLAEDGEATDFGLVIPADYDATVAAGGAPVLTVYVMAWAPDDLVRDQLQTVEGEIAAATGAAVRFDEQRVVLAPDGLGGAVMPALSLVFIALMNGLMVPSNLLLEEKQSKTLAALLVSPATAGQVVLGKAISGAVYVILGVGVAAGFNHTLISHWGLIALGLVSGALFCVGLGLLVGSMVETKEQMMLWNMIFVMPMLLPIFLSLLTGLIPDIAIAVFRFIPTVALFDVFRLSMVGAPTFADWAPRLALCIAWAALVLGLVIVRLRRSDRA